MVLVGALTEDANVMFWEFLFGGFWWMFVKLRSRVRLGEIVLRWVGVVVFGLRR